MPAGKLFEYAWDCEWERMNKWSNSQGPSTILKEGIYFFDRAEENHKAVDHPQS